MLRKVIVVIAMIVLVSFSAILYKKSAQQTNMIETDQQTEEQVTEAVEQEVLPENIFTFNIENLSDVCSQENAQLCSVENAVKCTINPDLKFCATLKLPEFIFMKDPSVDRPSEISYKIVNKKVLPNNTTEIYTESACNGGWFGLCQGTVIYVLSPDNDNWQIKDIYAIE